MRIRPKNFFFPFTTSKTVLDHCSMRIKKIGEWIQYTGGMGKTFYFNEKTYEFQWEKPDEVAAAGEGEGGIEVTDAGTAFVVKVQKAEGEVETGAWWLPIARHAASVFGWVWWENSVEKNCLCPVLHCN